MLCVAAFFVTTAAEDTTPLYCGRCNNPRPLGILGHNRFWSRQGGRTLLFEGGKVTVWCERCHKEHDIDLSKGV